MRYIVREPGKTGGAEYMSADDAVDAAVEWYRNTGIHCEIWLRLDGNPAAYAMHSIQHSTEVLDAIQADRGLDY